MPGIELNLAHFSARTSLLYNAWTNAAKHEEYELFNGLDALLLVAGEPAGEDEPLRKTTALQTWLLGYEFPSTFTLFTKDKIYFLCSASKAKILSQLQSGKTPVPVEIFAQARPKDPPTDAIPKLVAVLSNAKRVGSLPKEVHTGRLISDWTTALTAAGTSFETVDISLPLGSAMAVKDEEELAIIRTAANLTSTLLAHHVALKLEAILDKEAKITHAAFAEQIEARLGSGEGENAKGPDMKVWSKARGSTNVDFGAVEFAYTPIIQSRSTQTGYDLRSSAESTTDIIAHKGVFLISLGLRYKGYCANLGRSFIVDPTPEQEEIYKLLRALQVELLSVLRDGSLPKDVYAHAISFIRARKPDLEKHFVKSVGFGIGLEFRDSAYLLSAKNTRPIRAGMVFNLALGFTDLEDGGKKYALQLTDTVRVNADRGAVTLTEGTKEDDQVLFFISGALPSKTSADKSSPTKKKLPPIPSNKPQSVHKVAGSKVLRGKTRGAAQDEVAMSAMAKLAEHQRELHARLQEEGLAKYAGEEGGGGGKEGQGWKRFISYKGEAGLPREAETLRIYVDRKNQTIILPVNGFATPFHINTIKNASKSDEGDWTYLRINFQTPGQLAGKKEDTPFENPDATFLRSVTYRSTDSNRFDSLYKQITELKKEVNKREQQKKEMADVVEQDTLVEIKGRRPHKLPEVFVRPPLDGKRLPGEVEVHSNGIRYQSPLGSQKIDVLFSNVKHLFFQPCDHELLVIIHVHLKSPIMIGKKKTKDVQFYREASDVQFDETGNRKRKYRYGDEDEIELEQNERKRRQALNKEFKAFAEKIADASTALGGDGFEVDIPFRELSFEGVPHRASVKLQPTTDCLVHLSDQPFLVITLSDITIASLERVVFGLKQFDLVFIFSDFSRPPLQINSIPSTQLDNVKEWLDSVEIPMSESPVNFNWQTIMKTVNDDPYEFFLGGGWSFLGGPPGGDGSEAGSEASESESEFEEPDDYSVSESSSDGSEFDDGSDASDDSGSDFGAGSSDEGEDWDEMERDMARADKKKANETKERRKADSDSDDDRRKKKSTAKAPPPKTSKPVPSKSNGKAPAKANGKR